MYVKDGYILLEEALSYVINKSFFLTKEEERLVGLQVRLNTLNFVRRKPKYPPEEQLGGGFRVAPENPEDAQKRRDEEAKNKKLLISTIKQEMESEKINIEIASKKQSRLNGLIEDVKHEICHAGGEEKLQAILTKDGRQYEINSSLFREDNFYNCFENSNGEMHVWYPLYKRSLETSGKILVKKSDLDLLAQNIFGKPSIKRKQSNKAKLTFKAQVHECAKEIQAEEQLKPRNDDLVYKIEQKLKSKFGVTGKTTQNISKRMFEQSINWDSKGWINRIK